MRASRVTFIALVVVAAGDALVRAVQQGVGQTPSPLPLSQTVRERGSSVTGAYEGWYYGKDGEIYALVGYFNRNTKQEFDIPVGPNNHLDPDGPDLGQPTHFMTGRQWGVFSVKLPKDFGDRRITWTLVANGFTNSITLHTKPEYIVEPYEDAASKNTPPKIRFEPNGPEFTGPPLAIGATYTATSGTPLPLTVWATDEGPKINIPESTGRGRRGAGAGAQGRGRGSSADAAAAAAAAAAGFVPAPPLAITWSMFRGPGPVKFDKAKPEIEKDTGKTATNATFTAPGEYLLRVEGNDSTGPGGGGFQCCWTNVHVKVTVRPAATSGQ
jgi:hypothetical protein